MGDVACRGLLSADFLGGFSHFLTVWVLFRPFGESDWLCRLVSSRFGSFRGLLGGFLPVLVIFCLLIGVWPCQPLSGGLGDFPPAFGDSLTTLIVVWPCQPFSGCFGAFLAV